MSSKIHMEKTSQPHKQPTTQRNQTKLMIRSYVFFTNRYLGINRIRNMHVKLCVRKRDVGGITLLDAKYVVNIDSKVLQYRIGTTGTINPYESCA